MTLWYWSAGLARHLGYTLCCGYLQGGPAMARAMGQRAMQRRLQRLASGKLPREEVQHLKRLGVALPMPTPRKRLLRRFADWWETTPAEKALEDIEHILSNSALLNIVNLVAGVTIILSLATWWLGREERRENELFATWSIINDADQDQSGVVRVAVERLHRNGFSLSGLVLSGTYLEGANLERTGLSYANLQGAILVGANLQGAALDGSNLQEANLAWAYLAGTYLGGANLQGAVLEGTNLAGANLASANLARTNLREANLEGARNITQDQLTQAKLCGTKLPDDITLDPNRDCEEMGFDPKTGMQFLPPNLLEIP